MLEIYCGPIACGKSTHARQREDVVVYNDDALMTMLHPHRYGEYHNDLIPLYKSTEHHIIQMALAQGFTVVIDSVNHTLDRRTRLIHLAKALGHRAICHAWPWTTPEESGTARYYADARGLSLETWINIAELHYQQYEPPSLEEGYMDIFPHAG